MPWAPQGLAKITQWKASIKPLPLVAIGGLTVERATDVFHAGADSCAVVTDVLRHEQPETPNERMDHGNKKSFAS